jgi:predicted dienelactone hydrolase
MDCFRISLGLLTLGLSLTPIASHAAEAAGESAVLVNRIDLIRHDAPPLAAFGPHAVGVRTLELADPGRIDVVNTQPNADTVRYDRPLTVEVWYPAMAATGSGGTQYTTETRNLAVIATLHGSAVRDAESLREGEDFPLVILSHGYPGNRFLMSHLGENLASKGYVVASIDHTDSTYRNQQPIASTLYNRAPDQRFVLASLADAAKTPGSFLEDVLDADNTALIGFSMGGYGLLNNIGASYNEEMIIAAMAPANGILRELTDANPDYRAVLDTRIKAAVAIAPWGMNSGFFTQETLAKVNVPVFFVAGTVDSTAGYDNGTRAIFENTTGTERYLLSFVNGGHSVAAPIPIPQEILQTADKAGAGHYADAVWDTVRSNNILAHYATAFLDLHLKSMTEREGALGELPERSVGLVIEHRAAGE